MLYFRNTRTGEVYAYDETDPTQIPYMDARLAEEDHEDISNSWPPAPVEYTPPEPNLNDLHAQLAVLQSQLAALANKGNNT